MIKRLAEFPLSAALRSRGPGPNKEHATVEAQRKDKDEVEKDYTAQSLRNNPMVPRFK